MHGALLGLWPEMWHEVWLPVFDTPLGANEESVPEDVFCELYRELAKALKSNPSVEAIADIIDDPVQSREAFENTTECDIAGERALVSFLESVHSTLDELGGDELSNRYFNLLSDFIKKFSLRYDLRRPCTLCPTLPGMFTSLMHDIGALGRTDQHLDDLIKDFEDAVRDLRQECSDARIKTCIQKQVNLLEAIGRKLPGVTGRTLGEICNQAGTWPHSAIKASLSSLYGFASDYPGIRHAGNPDGVLRPIEMRDLVAVSILLAGFMPYLTDALNADAVYRGI